jgi:hypothetical protein
MCWVTLASPWAHAPRAWAESSEGQRILSEKQRLSDLIDSLKSTDAASLIAAHTPRFLDKLDYAPKDAAHLDLLSASKLSLNPAEAAVLHKHGFAISARQQFVSFTEGYEHIYAADLPVYVSADSILFALHRSYDKLLSDIEESALIPDLDAMLSEMRAHLKADALKGLDPDAIHDVDVTLAVALSLLRNGPAVAVAGGDDALIKSLFDKATRADGAEEISLFGDARFMDFSQHKPRGHYTDSEMLSRYFRAMIWLGRTDLRMIETRPDGTQALLPRQLAASIGIHALLAHDPATLARWQRIDATITALVGVSDNMTPAEIPSLLKDLGVTSLSEVASIPADKLAQALVEGGYGQQHIASQMMCNAAPGETLPLASAFALMGQRFTPDSFVLSNVVFDRVKAPRMMPSPLDAAFAAFGNGNALSLLQSDLDKYSYAADLEAARILVAEHGPEILDGSLYMLWVGALRTLSADGPDAISAQKGLPSVAQTEAWGRRLLNTQLASWAELRHDTILYAKQSYSGMVACEFPDAYIDPYPAFFAAIERYAAFGAEKLAALPYKDPSIQLRAQEYFRDLKQTAGTLREMAALQREGKPHTAEHLAFINDMIKEMRTQGCGGVEVKTPGWYRKMFYAPHTMNELDPTIADVHTQPTDAGGAQVGKVLHVGTGMPRLMVVTVNTCSGPKAYVGLASAYFEVITDNFNRLDDPTWKEQVVSQTPPTDVPWMKDLIAR